MNKAQNCLEEVARVVAFDGAWVWVEADARSACQSCATKANCGSHAVSSIFGSSRKMRVKIANDFGARLSESVVIGWGRGNFLKTVALTYLLPCVMCVLCAAIGGLHSEGASALGALTGLAGGLGGIWFYNRFFASQTRPDIVFLRRTKGNLT